MVTPDPIVLTPEAHIDEIMSLWRVKDADRLRDLVIFEEDERMIAAAMHEPEPRPIDKAAAAIWSGYCGFLAFGGLLLFEMLRP